MIDLRSSIEPALARLESWRGHSVTINESISRNPGLGHDANFASQSHFAMTIGFVAQTSGGHLSIDGASGARYQITMLDLVDLRQNDGEIVFVERLSETAERRSTIKLKS